jgi:hypothetical protein
MARRSNFARIDKDHYPTIDPRAVPPLVPHLGGRPLYAEPMAGEGHLIDLLAEHADLAWASTIDGSTRPDIHESDVLNVGPGDAEMFITNPVWKRPLLHKLIVHLSDMLPTWLLFDSNWANTRQARPYMERCRRIVAVGRLKWIPGTKMSGKEDVSWFLFDKPIAGSAPVFYGRGCLPAEAQHRSRRICHDCGILIDRFGKWRLQMRNGTLTPVHINCQFPSSRLAPGEVPTPVPMPLLDWRAPGETDAV